MNCVDVCPKGLNPTKAIGKLKISWLKKWLIKKKNNMESSRELLENDIILKRFFKVSESFK